MFASDPRYATYPKTVGLSQLHWFIYHVATGQLPVSELVAHFREAHETIERQERPHYRTREEARLIWDVLWALEFYSSDPTKEEFPAEWNSEADVLAEVKRVAAHLKEL
jgi:hypothetical protein